MDEGKPPRFSRRKVLGLGAAGLVAGTAVGIFESGLQRTERTLRLPRWKADGFRIAQVTDVHVNNSGLLAAAQAAVRIAVDAKPDLFVFTGDFINYDDPSALANIAPAFEALHDLQCPCLGIFGNHDYWSGAIPKIRDEVRKTPMRLLVNEDVEVDGVRIVGLDDGLAGQPDYAMLLSNPAPSTVVLLHEPDYSKYLKPTAGLVLSGHSHGGEICLPGGIPFYTPTGSRRYQSGYYSWAPTPVYVNRGTATLGPARVYCPPEVAIFTLREA